MLCQVKPAALQNITAKIGTFGQIPQIIFYKFSRDLNGLTGAVWGGWRSVGDAVVAVAAILVDKVVFIILILDGHLVERPSIQDRVLRGLLLL